MIYKEIDVHKLNQLLKSKKDIILLDVRTDQEVLLSKIDQSIHIPMQEISERYNELDKNKEIIVQCKSGKRSARVCEFLFNQNFKNVKNLKGGIIAWSEEIDPSILIF